MTAETFHFHPPDKEFPTPRVAAPLQRSAVWCECIGGCKRILIGFEFLLDQGVFPDGCCLDQIELQGFGKRTVNQTREPVAESGIDFCLRNLCECRERLLLFVLRVAVFNDWNQ